MDIRVLTDVKYEIELLIVYQNLIDEIMITAEDMFKICI